MEILHEVSANELHKMIIDEVMNTGIVYMIGTELRELRQEAVREGLTIYLLYDIRHGSLVFLKEKFFKIVTKLVLEQVSH